MSFSKARFFTQTDFHFSMLCHALSHPARIAILRKLIEEQCCSTSGFTKEMPLCRASVSQHLMILREMHILQCAQQYPTVLYSLNPNLPATYRAIIDMILKVDQYFPRTAVDEISSVNRFRGAVQYE